MRRYDILGRKINSIDRMLHVPLVHRYAVFIFVKTERSTQKHVQEFDKFHQYSTQLWSGICFYITERNMDNVFLQEVSRIADKIFIQCYSPNDTYIQCMVYATCTCYFPFSIEPPCVINVIIIMPGRKLLHDYLSHNIRGKCKNMTINLKVSLCLTELMEKTNKNLATCRLELKIINVYT